MGKIQLKIVTSFQAAVHKLPPTCFVSLRPLVSTLAGLLLSNLGLISANAPEYTIVNKYLLTLAVPLLLLSADLR